MLMLSDQSKIAGHKAGAVCHAKGMEGGIPMDSTTLWRLFVRTGLPEVYSLYRHLSQTEGRPRRQAIRPDKGDLR